MENIIDERHRRVVVVVVDDDEDAGREARVEQLDRLERRGDCVHARGRERWTSSDSASQAAVVGAASIE